MIRHRRALGATWPVLLLAGCATSPDGVGPAATPSALPTTPQPAARPLPAFEPKAVQTLHRSPPAPLSGGPLRLDYRHSGRDGEIGLGGRLPVPRLGWFTRAGLDLGAGAQGHDRRFMTVAGARLKLKREAADRRWQAGFEFGSALRSRPAVRAHWTQRVDAGAFGSLTGGVLVATAALPEQPFEAPSAASVFTSFWQPALHRAGASSAALALGRLA